MKVNIPYIDPMAYKTQDTTIQENYNTPVEHTLGNSPTIKGIPANSMLVKV